ncbi:thrombospondin-2-like [Styela clava]
MTNLQQNVTEFPDEIFRVETPLALDFTGLIGSQPAAPYVAKKLKRALKTVWTIKTIHRNSTGEKKKIETCVKPECIEYHWGEWFKATECSASCGTGEIEMKRKCLDSDNVEVLDTSECNPGKYVELRTCNLKPCPVYKWNGWKTSCSVTCGTGVLTKTRNCTDQDGNPAEDVLSCGHGKSIEKDVCTSPCPLISKESSTSYHWGKWGSWSTCRLRMGGVTICNGFKSSTRDCLMGSKDVNPRRCSGEYPGEDFYRESSCMMETSNCP